MRFVILLRGLASSSYLAASFEHPEYFENYATLDAALSHSPFAVPAKPTNVKVKGRFLVLGEATGSPKKCEPESLAEFATSTNTVVLCTRFSGNEYETLIAGRLELYGNAVLATNTDAPLSMLKINWEPATPPKVKSVTWKNLEY